MPAAARRIPGPCVRLSGSGDLLLLPCTPGQGAAAAEGRLLIKIIKVRDNVHSARGRELVPDRPPAPPRRTSSATGARMDPSC